MAYSVINGAVGKSPLIDKLNQLPKGQIEEKVSEQMEQLVCSNRGKIDQPISLTFDECKKELKRQLYRLRQEGAKADGEHER